MGTRTMEVNENTIVCLYHYPPYVSFRPDVQMRGDILYDKEYSIVMVEVDGVMTINISKKKEGG